MLTEKLTTLRKAKCLSQSELAEKLDVSRQAVSRWETGDAAPSIENLKGLRDLYGVSIDYLLSDEKGEGTAPMSAPAPEPEPDPVEPRSAPAPVRPRHPCWTIVAVVIIAFAAVAALVLLLLPGQTQENPDPFSGFDGSSPVYGEDGKPIEGKRIEGFDSFEFELNPLE